MVRDVNHSRKNSFGWLDIFRRRDRLGGNRPLWQAFLSQNVAKTATNSEYGQPC